MRNKMTLLSGLCLLTMAACGPTDEDTAQGDDGVENNQQSGDEDKSSWTSTITGLGELEGTGADGTFVGDGVTGVWRSTDSKLEFVTNPAPTLEAGTVVGVTVIASTPDATSTGTFEAFARVDVTKQGYSNCSTDEPGGSATVEITRNKGDGFDATINATVVCSELDPKVTLSVSGTFESNVPIQAL